MQGGGETPAPGCMQPWHLEKRGGAEDFRRPQKGGYIALNMTEISFTGLPDAVARVLLQYMDGVDFGMRPAILVAPRSKGNKSGRGAADPGDK